MAPRQSKLEVVGKIVLFVPATLLKSFQKTQICLVCELERKFSGKHAVSEEKFNQTNTKEILENSAAAPCWPSIAIPEHSVLLSENVDQRISGN